MGPLERYGFVYLISFALTAANDIEESARSSYKKELKTNTVQSGL